MKFKISKSAYDKLSDDLKLEYKEQDGAYILQIEGQPAEEGSAALRNALDRERTENTELRATNKELNTKLTAAEEKAGQGDAELKRENTRLTKKIETMQTEFDGKIQAKDTAIANTHRDNTVNGLAAKISTSPAVIAPHIAGRLEVTIDPDTNLPKVAIKGKDGKIDPALTLDKLGEEFVANPDFKGIIRASGATGSRPPVPGGGAPASGSFQHQQNNQPVDLARADNRTLIETIRARHAERNAAG